jgi:hypothetical protein|tara:strand:+ start:943 stop:2193 length:1251 start_codon:yes stop_codon:yes gene_type:complete
MASVPLNYKLSFYDPSVPTGVITIQENNTNAAVRLDTQFSMQDILDTVSSSESVSSTTQTLMASIPVPGDPANYDIYNNEMAQALSEDVDAGDVTLIFPIKSIRAGGSDSNSQNYLDPHPGFQGIGHYCLFEKPIIINKSQYTNAQLFGYNTLPYGQFNADYISTINFGFVSTGWLLKGLWEVEVNVQYSAWRVNLHDGANPTPIHLMTTIGGGKNSQIDYEVAEDDGSNFDELFRNETIIGSHKFESDTKYRDVVYEIDAQGNTATFQAQADFFTHEISHKQLINNWQWHYFNVQTYANGGSGVGPGGAPRLYGGANEMNVSYVNANPAGFSQYTTIPDAVRVNDVTLPSQSVNSFGHLHGGPLDFTTSFGSTGTAGPEKTYGVGFVRLTWVGATAGVPSYYYYGGDGIGVGNLD